MPRPRTDSDDPAVIRRRTYRERQKAGLVVVAVTVHQSRRAEIEAAAALMLEPLDASPAAPS